MFLKKLNYYDKLKSLYQGEPDLFAIETLPGINEATVALDVLQNECEMSIEMS